MSKPMYNGRDVSRSMLWRIPDVSVLPRLRVLNVTSWVRDCAERLTSSVLAVWFCMFVPARIICIKAANDFGEFLYWSLTRVPLKWKCFSKISLRTIWAALIRMTASSSELCLQACIRTSPVSFLKDNTTSRLLECSSSCGSLSRSLFLMWVELGLFMESPPSCVKRSL